VAEPHPTDRLVRELVRLYGDAHQRTLERLAAALRQGRSPVFYRAWLRELQQILAELRTGTHRWALGEAGQPGAVDAAWRAGAESSVASFAAAGRQLDTATFAVVNRDAVTVTARNLTEGLDAALQVTGTRVQGWLGAAQLLATAGTGGRVPLIGRRVQDELRRAGLEATARKLTEGLTVRDMRRVLLDDLVQRGITVVQDQAGRNWSLPAYSEMVARTTTREAYTQGTIQVVERAGHDLVRASTHWPTCPMCAPRQGRVYSLSGRTPGWPALAAVGPTPWHPNCGHSLAPFVPDLTDSADLERLQELSNRPFDDDPRSRDEVDAYNRSQRINALRRERRRLLAQREADVVPLDAHMRRWAEELQRSDVDPARRRQLQEKLSERAEQWETGRRQRLRQVNAELRQLVGEQRRAIQRVHRQLGGVVPVTGGAGPVTPSSHPVDVRLREVVTSRRRLTPGELAGVRAHVARAGFSERLVAAGRRLTGVQYEGRQLDARERIPSDVQHWLLRVVADQQWPPNTSRQEFLRSLRVMLRQRPVAAFTYRYRGEDILLLIVRTLQRYRGPQARDLLGVIYSATYGRVKTAYQDHTIEEFLPRGGATDVQRHI